MSPRGWNRGRIRGWRGRGLVAALLGATALLLTSCNGSATGATSIGPTTAVLTATGSCNGGVPIPCSYYWQWGLAGGGFPHSSAVVGPESVTWSGNLSYQLSGLQPGVTYQYRICGRGDSVSYYNCTSAVSFTTQSAVTSTAIGLYSGPAATAAHTSFESWLGRSVPYVSDYVAYTNGWATDFNPTWLYAAWGPWVQAVPGRRLVLGVPLLENGYAGQFAQVAAGAFDRYFSELGQGLVDNGLGNTIIRLGYEANNPDIGPWQATDDPSGFVQAYRHVVALLRSIPGSSFSFDWNPTAGLTPNKPLNSFASFYPGDDVVDMIGLDLYDIDWAHPMAPPTQRWSDYLNETMGLNDQVSFAASHNKPLTYPEWGLYKVSGGQFTGGGDDPYFIDQMANWFATHNTLYQCYFNLDWGGGVLSDFPQGAARYQADFGPPS